MKLHKKTLLIIGAALISLIVVLYTTASFILIHNFHNLETESVHQDVVRAMEALEDDLSTLDAIAQDHAKWDDTYAFIDRHDSHYVRSNLVNTTFIDLKLNLFVLADARGEIAFGKGFDLDAGEEVPIPESLLPHIRPDRLLFSDSTPPCPGGEDAAPCPKVGILMLPDGPLLLSARPILTSIAAGPSRGTLMIGRYLDSKEIERLAEITQLSLHIDPISRRDPGGSPWISETGFAVTPLNASTIVGDAPIFDIYNRPALRLRVTGDRPIYRQGRTTLIYLTVSLFIVGILLSGITLLVFEKLILTRLLALTHRVNQIGKSRDLSMRVAVPEGEDELSDLGKTINEMLEALERANVQSRDSEERYRLMAEHSTDLITRHARRGTIRYASPACYTLLGYEPEELIGRHPSQFLHPDDTEALANTYDIVLTQNVSYTLTYRIRHKNGEYIWFETTSRAIYDPDTGAVQEILGVSRDISDRKQREQELQESEASIRSLYQITSARNVEWAEQLQQILELGCQKFGLEVGLLARIQNLDAPNPESEIQAVVTPDDSIRQGQVFQLNDNAFCLATARAGKPLIFESVLVSGLPSGAGEDGGFEVEAYMGIPVQVDGATYGTLCFWSRHPLSEPFRAVDRELIKLMAQWVGTELERQQTARDLGQARDEALAATRAKSEFLATMSHEIRTPMNAVIGMTGLLLDTSLSPIQQDFVETIRSSSDALLSLINDILDFSKIESGKLDLETFPFSLRTCVEESIDLLVTKAAGKNLELGYLIDPSTPHQVVGDMARVRQILVNLLSNAVKFTASGDVLVSAKATPLSPERYEIQLSVKDTGIGIPPEGMGRLFKSFSQVDASTNRQYGGTGLGLAISKRLAEMMGGRMWVTSHNAIGGDPPEGWEFAGYPSVGSTFYFSIVVESSLNVLPEWSHTSELTGKRLLLLCTHPTSGQILTANVRAWGLAVEAAETPTRALEWLGAGTEFDAAIVEVPADGGDGSDVVREIRRSPAGRKLPLVMLTSVGRQNLNRSEFGEFVAFLSKPIKQSPLYNILVNVLCGEPLKMNQWSGSPMRSPQDIPLLAEQLPLRILLAEDHLVNQKVALQILRRMGYRADVAGNGLEVLEALQRQPYDVILMDMQMPIMDGLEAARQIQKRYGDSEKARARRPRIIAVTANAMESDRAECMEAGMDDYISKPIRMERLVKVLGKCRPVVSDLDLGAAAAPKDGDDNGKSCPVLDPGVVEGLRDIEALEEVVEMYLESAPELLRAIDVALKQADAAALKQAAHSLKSISGTLGAFGLSELCLKLEMIGRRGVDAGTPIPETEARGIYDRVEVELKRVESALKVEVRS